MREERPVTGGERGGRAVRRGGLRLEGPPPAPRRLTPSLVALLCLAWVCGCSDPAAPRPSDPRLFESVRAGGEHTCGFVLGGDLSCWGRNHFGQVGDGTGQTTRVPVGIGSELDLVVADVGWDHTCAVSAGGATYCWGHNHEGQLGTGEADEGRASPTPVTGGIRFHLVAAGGAHTCGLTDEGRAYCWGNNREGGLGVGLDDEGLPTPTPVATEVRFTALALGTSHTCGLDRDGKAWCWGLTALGAVGAQGQESCDPWGPCTRVPLPVEGGHTFTRLTAGGEHTCAVDESGASFCWGRGSHGQLGFQPGEECLVLGTFPALCSTIPERVPGDLEWTDVSAGGNRTCGLTREGTAWCWGEGNLGAGSGAGSLEPARVATSVRFTRIDTGYHHSCGVARDGVAWCWGSNQYGQLGDGSQGIGWPVPVPVKGW